MSQKCVYKFIVKQRVKVEILVTRRSGISSLNVGDGSLATGERRPVGESLSYRAQDKTCDSERTVFKLFDRQLYSFMFLEYGGLNLYISCRVLFFTRPQSFDMLAPLDGYFWRAQS